ncbi:MAG: (2Fe-2S)-binding protein, partial [Paracoccaceae bacterium]|nr:(2Fe-2S)-binding protein [Paracoccaceae bacterium]
MAEDILSAKDLLVQLNEVATGLLADANGAEPALYWNEEIAALEDAKIFRKDWVCAGLAAEIPNKG